MLHGITDTWRSFEPVLPWLPPDWHVIAMTQRGHDGSSAAPSYRTRYFAADAAALVATLGLAPVLVVGHSMGAVNALRLAIDHPALVRGVVAAGGFASFSDKPELVDFIRSQMLTLGEQVPRELAEAFQRDTVAGPVAPGLLDTMVDECLRTPAATWRGAFAALLDDDFSTELHAVQVPVLLPWGDADAFSPESDQQRLQRQLPSATRAVYAGVGHALHWEQPRRFADDLVAFEQTLRLPCRAERASGLRQPDHSTQARRTSAARPRGAVPGGLQCLGRSLAAARQRASCSRDQSGQPRIERLRPRRAAGRAPRADAIERAEVRRLGVCGVLPEPVDADASHASMRRGLESSRGGAAR